MSVAIQVAQAVAGLVPARDAVLQDAAVEAVEGAIAQVPGQEKDALVKLMKDVVRASVTDKELVATLARIAEYHTVRLDAHLSSEWAIA
jgi:hypothetical protein